MVPRSRSPRSTHRVLACGRHRPVYHRHPPRADGEENVARPRAPLLKRHPAALAEVRLHSPQLFSYRAPSRRISPGYGPLANTENSHSSTTQVQGQSDERQANRDCERRNSPISLAPPPHAQNGPPTIIGPMPNCTTTAWFCTNTCVVPSRKAHGIEGDIVGLGNLPRYVPWLTYITLAQSSPRYCH